ncbi:MAG: YerC/YecD family TrpR-related protein [Candidatus Peregrinibacteria bacterium]
MKKSFTDSNWRRDPWFMALCKAFTSCKTERETAELLRDVGTLSELLEWSGRLEIARRIKNSEPYREITEATGASTTTVTRVGSFLKGKYGGYRRALEVLHHHTSHPRMVRHHGDASTREERLVPVSR